MRLPAGAPWLAPLLVTLPALAQSPDGTRDRDRPFPPIASPRTIDGSGNHPTNESRGAAFEPFARTVSVDYADGLGDPAGQDRPSARAISSAVLRQTRSVPNARGVSDLFWQWGQFLDHDLTETPIGDPSEAFPIAVPSGDRYFDPGGTGAQVIPLQRSFPVDVNGVREQVNALTAWIDGSQIYGSDVERAQALRTLDGTGRLRTSAGDLLPFNLEGLHNAPSDHLPRFFLAGDVRANEQIGLTALHTVFVREHNHWAERIRAEDERWIERSIARSGRDGRRGSGGRGGGRTLTRDDFESGRVRALSGDEIYELARAIVSAELQIVTYREWLPLLLGEGALPPGAEYRPELDATMSNEFATAAFRFGHSMLSSQILRIDAKGAEIGGGHIALAGAFFAPQEIVEHGIDPVLRGLAAQRAQELDAMVVDDIRNFLFGPPGAGGFDLASLNLQRGRDHGLASFAQTRRDLGLGAPLTLAEISSDPDVVARLERIARTPEDLDLWVGGLAEDDVPGAMVGPTFHAILVRQFTALRDGDRLWHTRQLPRELRELVEEQSLAQILRRNSGRRGEAIGAELSDRPFLVR
ncbi:MAG: peroxidase family protein [Planctomycetota bacterium]